MLQPVKAFYRRTVPSAVRNKLYYLRQLVAAADSLQRGLNFRLAAGRPLARVPLAHANLLVDLRDGGVGRPLYLYRSYEVAETRFLSRTLRRGMTVLDAGANIGYFTTLAAAAVGPSGRVVAVEPDPHNFNLLTHNVRNNGLGNVTLLNRALGREPGRADLFRSRRNFGDHRLYAAEGPERRDAVSVCVDTIDGVAERLDIDRIDVVKLDVQGYEHHVIRGMTRTIERNPDLLLLAELWPFGLRQVGESAAAVVDDLRAKGLSAYLLDETAALRVVDRELGDLLEKWDSSPKESFYVNVVFARGRARATFPAGH